MFTMPDLAPEAAPALTDAARHRLADLIGHGSIPGGTGLRLRVDGGGCSGFRYAFDFVDIGDLAEDDVLFGDAGAGCPALVVDRASLPFLGGARVDYVDAPVGARFLVLNQTARSGCGCGTSFDV